MFTIDNNQLDLVKLRGKKQSLDIDVYLGKEKNLKYRLVVQKLPDNVANERRRKAIEDRKKNYKTSKK